MTVFSKRVLGFIAGVLVSTLGSSKDFSASYSVPVKATLKKFANFPVQEASVVKSPNGETVTVRYRLPEDLTGKGGFLIEVTSPATSGNDKFFTIAAEATGTRGICVRTANGTTCMLEYTRLNLDKVANRAFLQAKYWNDPHLEQRLAVFDAFNGDAVGILAMFE